MKKFFTFAFAALIATAAMAQSPKTDKVRVKDGVPVQTGQQVAANAEITGSDKTTQKIAAFNNKLQQLMRNKPVVKAAAVSASIDEVVGNYKIKAESALDNGSTVSGTKISIEKKTATQLTIKGIDEDVDLVGTYADGVLTIPATFLYKNTNYDEDVYWGAWVSKNENKENVKATWDGESFVFDADELIGAGIVGRGFFSLDSNMSWIKDTGAVQADISEILGTYIIQATSGLMNNSTKDGTPVTISQGDETNEVIIEGWTFTYPIKATYADGILTIPGQILFNNTNGDAYFGAWNTSSVTIKEKVTAEWTGTSFDFDTKEYIGLGWQGLGYNMLDRSVSLRKKPDGDFSATLTLTARTFAENKGDFTVALGGDVSSAKLIVIQGDYDKALLDKYAVVLGQDLEDVGTYQLDLSTYAPGIVTIYLATLDENENVVESTIKWIWVQDYNNDNWTSLGNALYTDDIVCSLYDLTPGSQWSVGIQQSKADDTKYRIVNIFGANSAYRNYAYDFDHFLNYNVTSEGVEFEISPLGVKIYEEEGDWFVQSYDGNNNTTRNVVLKDNVITVPKDGLLFMFSDYADPQEGEWNVQNGGGFYANRSGMFKLELPGQLTVNVKNNDLPAAGATVSIDEQDYTTDANGNVVINVDAAGDKSYDVIVALGTDSQDSTVDFKANGKAELNVSFGTSAINDINAEAVAADAPVYNLAGQRVENNAKGILIQNGKKFVNNK